MARGEEFTYRSPGSYAPEPEHFAGDPFFQHKMVQLAVDMFFQTPFERNEDLRGRKFEVTVHEDGLHTTIREV